jgi:hypothetical protein
MSVLSPPDPRQDELELLIHEARARQRKRRVGVAALVAGLAGATLGISSIVAGRSPSTSTGGARRFAGATVSRCGVRAEGVRILRAGQVVYREPGHYVHPNGGPGATIQCSGPTVWAVWMNGAGMSQEAYVGARSGDGGRTWRLVFSEPYFGVRAPHELDSYLGAWTLHGPRAAYFTGRCPACGYGTVSLWVTKNGGRTFRMYEVPTLTGYGPTSVRVSGHDVFIRAEHMMRKIGSPPYEIYGHKTVKLRVS